VGALLEDWVSLRQEEDESFDAYRARINQLFTLLDHTKEKPSQRMYSLMLLDRLQPRYKQAVLALKAGGQLKEADKIEWDTVAAFVNTHEREELRYSCEGSVNSAALPFPSASLATSLSRSLRQHLSASLSPHVRDAGLRPSLSLSLSLFPARPFPLSPTPVRSRDKHASTTLSSILAPA
jgi:hypothetical protein